MTPNLIHWPEVQVEVPQEPAPQTARHKLMRWMLGLVVLLLLSFQNAQAADWRSLSSCNSTQEPTCAVLAQSLANVRTTTAGGACRPATDLLLG